MRSSPIRAARSPVQPRPSKDAAAQPKAQVERGRWRLGPVVWQLAQAHFRPEAHARDEAVRHLPARLLPAETPFGHGRAHLGCGDAGVSRYPRFRLAAAARSAVQPMPSLPPAAAQAVQDWLGPFAREEPRSRVQYRKMPAAAGPAWLRPCSLPWSSGGASCARASICACLACNTLRGSRAMCGWIRVQEGSDSR